MDKQNRLTVLTLSAVLLVAGVLRLGWPDRSPPGLQIDEAYNAWSAYCLLKTGHDEHGASWPIFYTVGFDDRRSPLYLYLLMPFQALWGLSPYTTRLPAALGGVASVWLIYYIGRRWFSRAVGLTAAGLLAINPWHIQHTRWGHEGCIAEFLVLLGLAAVISARAPFTETDPEKPCRMHPLWCFAAGALLALSCYGYAAIRPYVPAFLLGSILVTWPAWRGRFRQKNGAIGITFLAVGFALPFGILVFKHLTDPQMNIRASQTWVWNPAPTLGGKLAAVAIHYLSHYSPGFLFVHGAVDLSQMPPDGFGMFHWYELALMLFGLVAMIGTLRSSYATRVLLIAVLVYPAGDTLSGYPTEPHALRSMVGMWALVLLAALGAVSAWQWLKCHRPRVAPIALGFMIAWISVSTAVFLYTFFGSYNRNEGVYLARNVGLQQVCQWLKPRLTQSDVVYWSRAEHPFIYAPIVVYLQYDPRAWFADPPVRVPGPDPEHPGRMIASFGPMHFMYVWNLAEPEILKLRDPASRQHAYFVVHPWEMAPLFQLLPVKAVYTALGPSGDPDYFVLEKSPQ